MHQRNAFFHVPNLPAQHSSTVSPMSPCHGASAMDSCTSRRGSLTSKKEHLNAGAAVNLWLQYMIWWDVSCARVNAYVFYFTCNIVNNIYIYIYCICIYTYIHTYIYTYIHKYIHTYICVYLGMCVHHEIYLKKTRWSPRTRMLTRMLMVQMSKHMVMQSRTIPFCNSLFEQSCTCFPCYQSAVWSGKCRAWSVECEVRSVECKVWSGECRVCKV